MSENENLEAETVIEAAPENTLENFDWDAIGKRQENYSKEERARLEAIYDKTLKN